MMHTTRRWTVSPVESAEKLADMLTQSTWTLCSGFYVAGHPEYLFLNDATSEDAAAEFAIVKGGLDAAGHVQVESITFSWLSRDTALAYIRQALAGEMDGYDFVRPVRPRLQTPQQHVRCHLCA